MNWQPIETAPKGVYSEFVTDLEYVKPPKILLLFEDGEQVVCYWEWYYSEIGNGYRKGFLAWTEPTSAELIVLYHGNPTHWMPLPEAPKSE